MSILPKTRDEWIAAPLLLFKAWVLLGYVLYFIFRSLVTPRVAGGMGFWVINGYVLSVGVLLIGALVQSIVCSRGAAMRTIWYVLGGILILVCGLGRM
jgi:Putative addiction module component